MSSSSSTGSSSDTLAVRPLRPPDRPTVLALNQADVHHLSPLDDRRLDELLAWCAHAEVVMAQHTPEDVLGFVLTVAPGTAYDSANYRWFGEHLGTFLYLDRIVVAAGARRQGIGSFIYDRMQTLAHAEHDGPLVCEVDVDPANDSSLAFHRARGFEEVGRQRVGDKTVAYFASP